MFYMKDVGNWTQFVYQLFSSHYMAQDGTILMYMYEPHTVLQRSMSVSLIELFFSVVVYVFLHFGLWSGRPITGSKTGYHTNGFVNEKKIK